MRPRWDNRRHSCQEVSIFGAQPFVLATQLLVLSPQRIVILPQALCLIHNNVNRLVLLKMSRRVACTALIASQTDKNYTSFASAFRTMPSGSTLRDEGRYRTENAVAAMRSDSTTAPNVPPSDHAYTS